MHRFYLPQLGKVMAAVKKKLIVFNGLLENVEAKNKDNYCHHFNDKAVITYKTGKTGCIEARYIVHTSFGIYLNGSHDF